MIDAYQRWVDDYIPEGPKREDAWTEALAVGSLGFIEGIKQQLGIRAKYRCIHEKSGLAYALREPPLPYNANFDSQMAILRADNSLFWHVYSEI